MTLDFAVRARVHALETAVKESGVEGIVELAPCIRSTMVRRPLFHSSSPF